MGFTKGTPEGVPKWSKCEKDILAVFRGEQTSDVAIGDVYGAFNMYNWFAIDNSGELKGDRFGLPATHTWVW